MTVRRLRRLRLTAGTAAVLVSLCVAPGSSQATTKLVEDIRPGAKGSNIGAAGGFSSSTG